jgi:hypothetical protein
MSDLRFAALADPLEVLVREMAAHQTLRTGHRDDGAYVSPFMGVPDPSHVGTMTFVGCAGAWLLGSTRPAKDPVRKQIGARFARAAAYEVRSQHPSGCIDLKPCNIDSGPDTGFAVQIACAVIELQRMRPRKGPDLPPVGVRALEQFVRRAVPGLATGGFHTPNHRWVVASALAYAGALFPRLRCDDVVRDYLAEGIDIDADGFYIERSPAIYDVVTNRSLLLLHEHARFEPALRAVERNLLVNLELLNADLTVETALSQRQDLGTRPVPAAMVQPLVAAALRLPRRRAQFLSVASRLLRANPHAGRELFWSAQALLRHGDQRFRDRPAPEESSARWPIQGAWRRRSGQRALTCLREGPWVVRATNGAATLAGVCIAHGYFGTGQFRGDTIDFLADGVRIRSRGLRFPRRPAYDLPLGRPVAPEDFEKVASERGLVEMPASDATLVVRERGDRITLDLRSTQVPDGTLVAVAFDFPAGGVWETRDAALEPAPGQEIFLRQGSGRMRYGADWIEIGPGDEAHRMWRMRDASADKSLVRVVIALEAPVRKRIELRFSKPAF